MDVNPYAIPSSAATKLPRGTWRPRFRRLCVLSMVVVAARVVLGGVINSQMPRNTFDAAPLLLIFRGLNAFCALMAMTGVGLFGIGWVLSPRSVHDGSLLDIR